MVTATVAGTRNCLWGNILARGWGSALVWHACQPDLLVPILRLKTWWWTWFAMFAISQVWSVFSAGLQCLNDVVSSTSWLLHGAWYCCGRILSTRQHMDFHENTEGCFAAMTRWGLMIGFSPHSRRMGFAICNSFSLSGQHGLPPSQCCFLWASWYGRAERLSYLPC